MNQTPKALRLHIGIFGRTNAGKSSFVNLVTNQQTSIVSPVAGTTTDVVRKSMELLPLGPVTFLDTAGIDDSGELGDLRVKRTSDALASSDVACLVVEPNTWGPYEQDFVGSCAAQNTPLIVAVNKTDLVDPSPGFLATVLKSTPHVFLLSCALASRDVAVRDRAMSEFKRLLIASCPESFLEPPAILGDLLPSGSSLPLAVFVVPIDLQAPRGRLILPQVQAIRDALDSDAAVAIVKDREYRAFLDRLLAPPDLVVCDSQVALKTVAETPASVPCTTFSILFSRFKGDIDSMAAGAAAISRLKDGDRVLIAEACTHHALEDDIGRVKIPQWLRKYSGLDIVVEHTAGKDYPCDLSSYALAIHCGACTLTRREMLWRLERARTAGIPVTNYGMAISALQGVIERTLSPFPSSLHSYRTAAKLGGRS